MPRTVQTTVYKYDELTDKAQERARKWYREAAQGDNHFAEFVVDDAKECLAFCGWDIRQIYFTGFWSQGDGACFEGTWSASKVDLAQLKEHAPTDAELQRIGDAIADIAKRYPHATMSVRHRGHYYHHLYTAFGDLSHNDTEHPVETLPYKSPEYLAAAESLLADERALMDLSRDAMQWVYSQLKLAYEYENADEQVADTIRANDYEFLENGKRA